MDNLLQKILLKLPEGDLVQRLGSTLSKQVVQQSRVRSEDSSLVNISVASVASRLVSQLR